MKIISVDNYDRESYNHPELFVIQIRDETRAWKIVNLINDEDHGDRYYKVVPDGYILKTFLP